ncbi:MAG: poly-gamma-glutamate synthase PgsB [Clostridiales bacterium]|nr:poly-gamma-glutamate synthase PgsB [Clostridiales bacterium]MDY4181247.1 poly-gamma-glutamate synthase PgsB [Pseudoflavonifractor sp.]
MLVFSLILLAGYLAWLLYEAYANRRALRSFQHVIHVNGIRGKTTTCRLIDAHLRQAGFKVFTKTTGTAPLYIDTAGVEHPIRRPGAANIIEQLSMIRKAYREGAEILILECMAVAPELQRVAQEKIVQGDWNVITNVRYDHIFEMGESLEEIAESLSGTIPRGGVLFTGDERFFPFFAEKCRALGTEAVLCRAGDSAGDEDRAIACAIGARLGISPDRFPEAAERYHEDFGACKCYPLGKRQFLDLFSANDPESSLMLLREQFPDREDLTLIYSHRTDRPDRLLLFIRCFFPHVPCRKVIVMGEGRHFARLLLRRSGVEHVETAASWRSALDKADTPLIAGIGNIKGQAYEMIAHLESGEIS